MGDAVLKTDSHIKTGRKRISDIRFLTDSTFILTFDRDELEFTAGQHVTIGTPESLHQREYSVYSSEKQDNMQILVKEILDGTVSNQLRKSMPGDFLVVNRPFGSFKLDTKNMFSKKHIFIATGTGISPFHSMIKSYPGIDYTILHGISFVSEAYDRDEYAPERYIPCTSKEKSSGFNGRVTDYLANHTTDPETVYYLCGNSSMIYEVSEILRAKGVSAINILREVYF